MSIVRAAVIALALLSPQAVAFDDPGPSTLDRLSSGLFGGASLAPGCQIIFGQPATLTIDTCKRTITAAPDVKVDDAAAQIIAALRPYLTNMSRGP